MNWLDIVIIVVLVFFTFIGLRTGIIRTALTFGGIIIGIVLAGQFHVSLAEALSSYIADANIAKIVAYIGIIVAVMVVANVVAYWLRRVVRWLLLGWVDHLGGAILGVTIGAGICQAVLIVFIKYPFFGIDTTISDSQLAPVFLKYFPILLELLPEEFDIVRRFFG